MMTELGLLRSLLLFGLAVAPLATSRFVPLDGTPVRVGAYLVALGLAAAGLFSPWTWCSVGWLLFTAAGFGVFLLRRAATLRTAHGLALAVPLLFANVAAVWLVGGSNDLGVLGYGPAFSYYAALHGTVLGWILVGAIAALAQEDGRCRRLYVTVVFVCFASFLLVAVGIDQLSALKPVGVAGLSVAIPLAQLAFLRAAWRDGQRAPFALGALSLAGLAFTMVLAWRNELGALAFHPVLGVRGMVSVHGAINALVVAPAFLVAVGLYTRRGGEGGVAGGR